MMPPVVDLVIALRLLREEVESRDANWGNAVANWTGGGPDGADDPCGIQSIV